MYVRVLGSSSHAIVSVVQLHGLDIKELGRIEEMMIIDVLIISKPIERKSFLCWLR